MKMHKGAYIYLQKAIENMGVLKHNLDQDIYPGL